MKRQQKNRGSALLLAVGLLTMIALLGGTFLIVSRFNARTTEKLGGKGEADQFALGVLSQLKHRLVQALYIDAVGPYHGSTAAGAERWKQFTDSGQITLYPVPDGDADVDTDGDGVPDTRIIEFPLKDKDGYNVGVAVTVSDLSGRINLSVAASRAERAMLPYTSPAAIDLAGFLGPALYSAVNSDRCGGADQPALFIQNNIVQRVLSPSGGCKPFAVCEEMYLRRHKSGAASETGRVHAALAGPPGLAPELRRMLTSYSCSRSLLRNPAANFKRRFLITAGANPVADPGKRQFLYEQLVAAGASQNQAAHFVVNLQAYLSPAGGDFAFTYPGGTVYGVTKQPFITEAYAAFKPSTEAASPHNHKWFAAVEVLNPYDVGLAGYTIAGKGVAIGGKSKKVYYNHNCADNSEVSSTFGITVGGSWERVNSDNFRFYGNRKISLTRGSVTVDSVSAGELGHSPSQPTHDADVDDIRRDDVIARGRYSVAVREPGVDQDGVTVHALGKANNVATAAYEGFFVTSAEGGGLRELGEVTNVYIVGPDDKGNDLPHALKAYAAEASRGRANCHVPPGGGNGSYPNVPWPTVLGELLEVIPPDQTRTDEAQPTRIYGRININTASAEVLGCLPWPTFLDLNGNGTQDAGEPAFTTAQANALGSAIAGYGSGKGGFLTPGEIAIPIADSVGGLVTGGGGSAAYRNVVDSFYSAASNVVTVNSDTFSANIVIRLGADANTRTYSYVAVIDRSNCSKPGDLPAVLLFSDAN